MLLTLTVLPRAAATPPIPAIPRLARKTQDTPLLKALGRCYYDRQHRLDAGIVADTVDIAKREGLGKVTVNETWRLAPLAPDIAEAISRGTLQRKVSMQLLLRNTLPLDWNEQRELIAGLG